MAAIGQANPNPFPIHGALWFDARDFGMSPSNPDNAPALQAAHDAAVAALAAYRNGQTPLATIFIPAAKGAYNFKGPVFLDGSNIRFLGEGKGSAQGTSLAKVPTYASPMFVVGMSRTGGGLVPNATYRPDLWNGGSPKLDNTVVTAANQKWGLRTNGDLVAMSHGSGLTHGGFSNIYGNQPDYWQETDYLTFEIALEGFASGQAPMPVAFIASGNGPQGPIPFVLTSERQRQLHGHRRLPDDEVRADLGHDVFLLVRPGDRGGANHDPGRSDQPGRHRLGQWHPGRGHGHAPAGGRPLPGARLGRGA